MAFKSKPVYIVDAIRLLTGKRFGYYKNVAPEVFTGYLLKKLFERNPSIVSEISEIILGTAVGTGGNMARYIALEAGIDSSIPAFTVDAQCVGSYKAIEMGYALIKAGMVEVVIVGGFESSSLQPTRIYHKNDSRFNEEGYAYAAFAPPEFGDSTLIGTAEATAIRHGISKEAMVDWTILSNQRAAKVAKEGLLNLYLINYGGISQDQTLKDPELIKTVANRNLGKLIDATTSCQYSDGAALAILCSEAIRQKLSFAPEFEITATASTASEIQDTPIAFAKAINELLQSNGLSVQDIDLFEINESFALKPLYFLENNAISKERVNILGGNLAYGHPFGASGTMNLIHLMAALKFSDKNRGVVAASAAGGLGNALLIQRL